MWKNKRKGGEWMHTLTLKLELYKPTKLKQAMYERMTQINTALASSRREQGDQQDFQGVFRREVPVCDHQPNHPGRKVAEETPTIPGIQEDVVFVQQSESENREKW
jgi:hypothetical protein